MNLPSWAIEIIAIALGVGVAEIPEIPIHVTSPRVVDRECGSRGALGCFVAEGGDAAIYIARNNGHDTAMIAHEYTHAVQWKLGMFNDYSCHRESEFAAYEVQNAVTIESARRNRERNPQVISQRDIERMASC